MRRTGFAVAASFFLAAILSAPAWGMNSSSNSALPGTLNYVEGQVSIGQQTLDAKSIGSAELQTGQTLTTERCNREITENWPVRFQPEAKCTPCL